MLVSRCCKADIRIEGHLTMYYVCQKCHRACDAMEGKEKNADQS